MGVFTEIQFASINNRVVENVKNFRYPIDDMFAKQITEHYEKISASHPSIARLQGLNEMVALTLAIEKMNSNPDLTYWIKKYQIQVLKTPKEQELLKRKWEGQTKFGSHQYGVSGGVELTAWALRLQAGDVTALRDAALKTRPNMKSLFWMFNTEWIISIPPDLSSEQVEIALLLEHVEFLKMQNRFNDVLTICNRILTINSQVAEAYYYRGIAWMEKRNYPQALDDFTKDIELDPHSAESFLGRAMVYNFQNKPDRAIADCEKAIELNSHLAFAYFVRGLTYFYCGDYERALADFTFAIEIDSTEALAYALRGITQLFKEQYGIARQDLEKALELDPFGEVGQLAKQWLKSVNLFQRAQYIPAVCELLSLGYSAGKESLPKGRMGFFEQVFWRSALLLASRPGAFSKTLPLPFEESRRIKRAVAEQQFYGNIFEPLVSIAIVDARRAFELALNIEDPYWRACAFLEIGKAHANNLHVKEAMQSLNEAIAIAKKSSQLIVRATVAHQCLLIALWIREIYPDETQQLIQSCKPLVRPKDLPKTNWLSIYLREVFGGMSPTDPAVTECEYAILYLSTLLASTKPEEAAAYIRGIPYKVQRNHIAAFTALDVTASSLPKEDLSGGWIPSDTGEELILLHQNIGLSNRAKELAITLGASEIFGGASSNKTFSQAFIEYHLSNISLPSHFEIVTKWIEQIVNADQVEASSILPSPLEDFPKGAMTIADGLLQQNLNKGLNFLKNPYDLPLITWYSHLDEHKRILNSWAKLVRNLYVVNPNYGISDFEVVVFPTIPSLSVREKNIFSLCLLVVTIFKRRSG